MTQQESKALQAVSQSFGVTKAQSDWQELKEQATLALRSGLLPKSVDTPEKAVIIALAGRELGLKPMQALCGIYVVNGMIALRGATMLRLIYERIPGARITVLTDPDDAHKECEVELQRPGSPLQRFKFTMDDARKANLLGKGPWQNHPAAMLRWSAIRTGARIVFADAIAGCYMEDELPAKEAQAAAPTFLKGGNEAPAQVEGPKLEEVPEAEIVVPEAEREVGSQPMHQPIPVSDDRPGPTSELTQPQITRLWAIAGSAGISRDQVHAHIAKKYSKNSTTLLTRQEYENVCRALQEQAKPATQSTAGMPAAQAGDVISPAQAKRLYAIAKKAGMENDEIADFCETHTGQRRTDGIPKRFYKEMCEFLELSIAQQEQNGGSFAKSDDEVPF